MAGRSWSLRTSAILVRMSFSQTSSDPCEDTAVTAPSHLLNVFLVSCFFWIHSVVLQKRSARFLTISRNNLYRLSALSLTVLQAFACCSSFFSLAPLRSLLTYSTVTSWCSFPNSSCNQCDHRKKVDLHILSEHLNNHIKEFQSSKGSRYFPFISPH